MKSYSKKNKMNKKRRLLQQRTEQNKKKFKRFISRRPSRFFSMNVKFQLPNQWFRSEVFLGGGGGHCAMAPLLTLPFSKKEQN